MKETTIDEEVRFGTLVDMFEGITRTKKSAVRHKHLQTFFDFVYKDHEYFSAMRLILPLLDKERGNYSLKEAALARALAEALGLSRESKDAQTLNDWKKGGKNSSKNVGSFALVAAEVLHRRQTEASAGITIRDLNGMLDRLAAAAEDRVAKVNVLRELISRTNVREMKWIIMIILKDLKLGMSEKAVLNVFHPDADDLFNVTCDLRQVCEKLTDRSQRYKRQDIAPGNAVKPQLAARVTDAAEAWKKLKGKEVLAECKFDGDRIQIHKNGKELWFYSRTFKNHTEYLPALQQELLENVLPERCILDGEMGSWHTTQNRFIEFGNNQGTAKAEREGEQSDVKLCYIAFDILYVGDGSVIHLPLRERHRLLLQAVRPVRNRLEVLTPDDGLNSRRTAGQPKWSIIARSAEEIHHFFLETVENRDEGIVVKDLDSRWDPGDRSNKWVKIKPDYVNAGADLDVLILGGYYGSGRRGGEIWQYLLGIAETPRIGGHPTRFKSFCKVGTGLTDEEADHLRSRLAPFLVKNEKKSKPPAFYTVTNNSKERPDVWVMQPEKSVILQVRSDIRTIQSEVFAAPFGLRFPRVEKVRYDKPWHDCLTEAELVELVHASGGNGGDRTEYGALEKQPKRRAAPPARPQPLLPSHLQGTDVSGVAKASSAFKGLVFYFVGMPPGHTRDELHKMAVEHGGSFSMNPGHQVTHVLAADKKGFRFTAVARDRDVIHCSWFLGSAAARALLPLKPKHYLHLSDATKRHLSKQLDAFGDSYYEDVEPEDLKQMFANMDAPSGREMEHGALLQHYERKYCPSKMWCLFRSCRVYAPPPVHSNYPPSLKCANIALKRLLLDVAMHGGSVAERLDRDVTHVAVYTLPERPVPFAHILSSAGDEEEEAALLRSSRVHVVDHGWLEESVEKGSLADEGAHELRSPDQILPAAEDALPPPPAGSAAHSGAAAAEPAGGDAPQGAEPPPERAPGRGAAAGRKRAAAPRAAKAGSRAAKRGRREVVPALLPDAPDGAPRRSRARRQAAPAVPWYEAAGSAGDGEAGSTRPSSERGASLEGSTSLGGFGAKRGRGKKQKESEERAPSRSDGGRRGAAPERAPGGARRSGRRLAAAHVGGAAAADEGEGPAGLWRGSACGEVPGVSAPGEPAGMEGLAEAPRGSQEQSHGAGELGGEERGPAEVATERADSTARSSASTPPGGGAEGHGGRGGAGPAGRGKESGDTAAGSSGPRASQDAVMGAEVVRSEGMEDARACGELGRAHESDATPQRTLLPTNGSSPGMADPDSHVPQIGGGPTEPVGHLASAQQISSNGYPPGSLPSLSASTGEWGTSSSSLRPPGSATAPPCAGSSADLALRTAGTASAAAAGSLPRPFVKKKLVKIQDLCKDL